LREATDVDGLVREDATGTEVFDIALTVGDASVEASDRIYLGYEGWLGRVSSAPAARSTSESNPFGALVAAAMAVARLHAFQAKVIGGSVPRHRDTWALNALMLTDSPGGTAIPFAVALPQTLLVGGGALASAIAYAMTHVPGLTGSVDTLDADVLKRTNSNRQITAPFALAKSESIHKVQELAHAWAAVRPEPLMYNEFKERRGRSAGSYELAVTAVDNTEARREVALDLPKVVIDGATGGLTVTLMRGADPSQSCVACAYSEVKVDEDELWSRRLGHSREDVQKLRDGFKPFNAEAIARIRAHGTLVVDDERERGLLAEGWAYLKRATCGNAKLDRNLPAASVSYVSAICGFLMAAQMVGEAVGSPTLVSKPRWVWDDVLRQPPSEAAFEACPRIRSCAERHAMRTKFYRNHWAGDE
jgi:hypothetical protein